MMGTSTETEEDWFVECSDDERYGPEKGKWEPEPKKIVELYERLSRGESLSLDWKLPTGGRRPPTPDKEEGEDLAVESHDEAQEDEKQEITEFDFDEPVMDDPITPKRTPGSAKVGRSAQKRVATLDKIIGDMARHKKINTPRSKLQTVESKDSAIGSASQEPPSVEGTPTRPQGPISPKQL